MDEFDYLNGTLIDWLNSREYIDEMSSDAIEWAEAIAAEYLPEFEAAIWKRAAEVA